ncbi:hypothetical protein PRK78_005661 [Emydomyces testavorans]|uniref:ABC transporter domain-containing protein n=1 Tax=Emydomyces testavorans TaxID=2070801 RepID=A0AAF0IKX7_9EURO|nr:hypothetical protein PRK78_005661 [Emydomyces testavorans]
MMTVVYHIFTVATATLPAIWSPAIAFIAFTIQAKIQHSNLLSTEQAFTSLALISLVTIPAESFMVAIPHAGACLGCFTRIQDYLRLPCRTDRRGGPLPPPDKALPSATRSLHDVELEGLTSKPSILHAENVICLKNVTVCPAPATSPVLNNITLTIAPSSLVMIVGPVGSGKTTLIKAILGELPCESGLITVTPAPLAYCHQKPWLTNTSILQSICGLHGDQAVDERWYKAVVYACCLEEDIKLWPDGSHTIIGNNGLMLSGGQRQRLALARAIYARRNVLLLDDVFNALDAATMDTIFTRLWGKQGLLRKLNSTVVLVTHSTKHVHLADKLVVLDKGRIVQDGSGDAIGSGAEALRDIMLEPQQLLEKETQSPREAKELFGLQTNEQDLARRTGDIEVYKYYANSIGWKYTALFVIANIGYAFAVAFPRE